MVCIEGDRNRPPHIAHNHNLQFIIEFVARNLRSGARLSVNVRLQGLDLRRPCHYDFDYAFVEIV